VTERCVPVRRSVRNYATIRTGGEQRSLR
jgi:hypothetical protein